MNQHQEPLLLELLEQLQIAVKHIENIQRMYNSNGELQKHPFATAGYKAVIKKATKLKND